MLFRKILSLLRPYGKYLIVSIAALLGITAINLATPMLVRQLINSLELSTITKNNILIFAALLAGAYLVRAALKFVTAQASHFASLNTVGAFQKNLYTHLQRLPRSFFLDMKTGDLMNRFTNDANQIEELVSHVLPDFAANVLTLIGVAIIMLVLSPALALATFLTLIPILACSVLYKKTGEKFDKMNAIDAELSGALQENISGMREIQLFNRQAHEQGRISLLINRGIEAAMSALNWLNSITPATEFFTAMGQVVVICFGGYLAWQNQITTGDIVGFLLYLSLFYAPVSMLSRSLESFQRAYSGARRVFKVLEEQIVLTDGQKEKDECSGHVQFDSVCFGYDGEKLLKDISFDTGRGRILAIAGPTGAGKTTLISLLVRLFDPQSGSVKIDGEDVRGFTLQSLRRHLSLVSQDIFLFNGTIADNIGYSVQDATQPQIEQAARNANIHEFITSLPDGYDTVIGERGIKLSGGQRQRVAIARALLRGSAILIFDEATSSLDTQTEREIRSFIASLKHNHTVIVIAHRLSTIADADEIIVLNDGIIEQRGSHEDLLREDGLYAKLHG